MFQKIAFGTFYAQTAVHVGTGSDIGVINLPIQREKHTTFPKMDASGIKGSIRAAVRQNKENEEFQGVTFEEGERWVFGSENNSEHAGALSITDAKCLFFPVKSAKGIFAWVTCPFVLERLVSDLKLAGIDTSEINQLPEAGMVALKGHLTTKEHKMLLEESVYEVRESEDVNRFIRFIIKFLPQDSILEKMLITNVAIIDNDNFTNIVNLCTEVSTRNRIDSGTGTVTGGALFQEELLPAETIMYALFMSSKLFMRPEERKDAIHKIESNNGTEDTFALDFLKKYINAVIQMGGDASLGKGLMAIGISWKKNEEGGAKND